MRFLLDANVISDLMRHPRGRAAARIAQVGDKRVCTSIIVAAELRYGAVRKNWQRLSEELARYLDAIEILPFEAPADVIYAEVRMHLERIGKSIGANDLLIAAHALAAQCTLVTDNEREFARIEGLVVENWLR